MKVPQDRSQLGRQLLIELSPNVSQILSAMLSIRVCTGEAGLYVMGASLVGTVMVLMTVLAMDVLI